MNIELLKFPRLPDDRGNLTFLQNYDQVPFEIKRVYWLYDIPGGEVRGGHAYRELIEVVIALSGSFDVAIDDGHGTERLVHLNRSYEGIVIPGMTWRQLRHFSTNSVALILASRDFDESDYIYSYSKYVDLLNG